jgi:pyruvate/2-oxoglutarate dehydrogenase complex dihydrolipoamide acyltransferase (E2) component
MMEFRLPQLSMGMSEATVTRWFVAEGEVVREGADLVEVESDKALLALPAPVTGVLLRICAGEGVDLEVHDLLALIQPGE